MIISKATRDADPDEDPVVDAVNNQTNAVFKTKDALVCSSCYSFNTG